MPITIDKVFGLLAGNHEIIRFMSHEPESTEVNQLVALFDSGRYAELESRTRLLIQQYPDSGFIWKALGTSLLVQGKEALPAMQKATELLPGDAETHCNLGLVLKNLGRLDDAVASYLRALEIRPEYAETHCNLGIVLKTLGRLNDAAASYRRALEVKPEYAEAHCNLGNALQDLGRLDDAVACYLRALEIKPDFAEARSNLLFTHNCLSDQSAEQSLADALRFGDLVAAQARPHTQWRNLPDPGRCLRVGLVSGDFRRHSVGYFVEAAVAALAADASGRVELVGYSNNPYADALTERIKACCAAWRSAVGLSDELLARLIRDDGIDILIDLSGHTARNRLPMFAWKPAPVQASWLGYLGTTGVAAMDYLIADPWTLPESEELNFTEKIWRLPESYLCFTRLDADMEISELPAIANGHVTFGCFNSLTKMNDAVVALWARVLTVVPGSCLFLKTKQLDETAVRQSVAERFAAHGIDGRRLMLEGKVPNRTEHLATHGRIDIALDPFPYPGITTSVEALWMGVPVLTMAGEGFLSRQGVGILMNAGLPEWIATGPDDYVARAATQASDLERLARLRKGLRQQVLTSALFDAQRFARHFEAALRGMWIRWCRQQHHQA